VIWLQAEAHADAAREFVMAELVTKSDLAAAIETQTPSLSDAEKLPIVV
jgi:hypothetical protein